MELFQGTITLSGNLDYFQDRGAYYVYHNLFGYILEMSRDLIDFLEYFRGKQRSSEEVKAHFAGTFELEQQRTFCEVFLNQGCLVPEGRSEEDVARRMVPFLSRWTVYHQPATGPVTVYLPEPDKGKVDVVVLRDWDAALWRLIDQERTIDEMIDELRTHPESPKMGLEEKVVASISKLTHCNAQLLKLSPRPMSVYRGAGKVGQLPPYLKSTMPYKRVTAEIRGERSLHVGLDVEEGAVLSREQRERDRVETTLSHLFREPHPALGGRSYGGALAHRAIEDKLIQAGGRVLECGVSLPELAVGFLDRLAESPELASTVTYTAIAVDEASRASLTASFAASGHAVTVLCGDVEKLDAVEGLAGPFELILCNEYLANLESVLMRKLTIGQDEEDEEEEEAEAEATEGEAEAEAETAPKKKNGTNGKTARAAREVYMGAGDSVNLIFRHNLKFHDANAEFLFNTGAVRFIEQASRLLAPGGTLAIIEFGDLFAYPALSGHDGEQTSIQFKTLQDVARSLGLQSNFEWVLARLDFDISMRMLGSTRRQFMALRALFAAHGVELRNIAYSRAMLEELVEGKLDLDEVHALEFSGLNDRVMGVVPSSVKILEMVRPAEGA